MPSYAAPLRDIRFVLHDVLEAPRVLEELGSFAGLDAGTIDSIMEEAGRFAVEILAPTRQPGDAGCEIEQGQVTTPPGFRSAYRSFVDSGWPTLACSEEWGGQGLPNVINNVLYEMLNGANLAFSIYPGIVHGAYECLLRHADTELKRRYLPKIVSGEWLATMALTEAHCGSDLGLVRTLAKHNEDGSYRIRGTKIFHSGGDHDLTSNIVHLVLARLENAPAGSKGLSLFLVPKHLSLADGSLSQSRNGVSVGSLEHKLGVHGSATCVTSFDDAIGWMIGEPHRGLGCMFAMMNAARLGVGVQSLGASELAYRCALDYARERLQMRSAKGPQLPQSPADPIVLHADVRRMLLTQKAWVEGARLLTIWLSLQLDIENHDPEIEARRRAADLLALLTPVAKAFLSDNALEVANLAVQVYGGHGYVAEHGVEQITRDVRILSIYEGTNGIQSLDLLGRKILADQGARLESFLATVERWLAGAGAQQTPLAHRNALLELVSKLRQLTLEISRRTSANADEAGAVSVSYLRLLGHCAMAFLYLRANAAAALHTDSGDAFYRAKLATSAFYFDRLFPETTWHLQVVRSGNDALSDIPEAELFVAA